MFAAPPLAAAERPNVLLIVSDDLNCDLGCYGHPVVKSPNIDNLAAKGVRFERAYCQYPWCNPSRSSLLSGLRPDSTGVLDNDTPPLKTMPNRVFLPQLFRDAGYFTAASGKIFHGKEGYDVPAAWTERDEAHRHAERKTLTGKKEFPFFSGGGNAIGRLEIADEGTSTHLIAERAAGWMERATREKKPFFVAAGFRKPHLPWFAPKKYFDLYTPESVPALPEGGGYPSKRFSDADRREVTTAYYACVSSVDAQVGALLGTLDRLKLWENTIVVFMSDHGYHLGDHGRWEKMSLFENSARGPLIVVAPGAAGDGKPSRRIVEYLDLYPTLADLAGLKPPADLQGASLRPLLADPAAAWDRPAHTVKVQGTKAGAGELVRTVRTERFRYITAQGKNPPQLFDLDADPNEFRDLAADPQFADEVARMKQRIADSRPAKK